MYCLIKICFNIDESKCQNISVTLKNDVLEMHGSYQGIYHISGPINDKPSWTSKGRRDVWYNAKGIKHNFTDFFSSFCILHKNWRKTAIFEI